MEPGAAPLNSKTAFHAPAAPGPGRCVPPTRSMPLSVRRLSIERKTPYKFVSTLRASEPRMGYMRYFACLRSQRGDSPGVLGLIKGKGRLHIDEDRGGGPLGTAERRGWTVPGRGAAAQRWGRPRVGRGPGTSAPPRVYNSRKAPYPVIARTLVGRRGIPGAAGYIILRRPSAWLRVNGVTENPACALRGLCLCRDRRQSDAGFFGPPRGRRMTRRTLHAHDAAVLGRGRRGCWASGTWAEV